MGQIVDGLTERDARQVLVAVAEGMASGRDARRLAADLLDHLRNGFLATMARGLVMLPDDAVAEVAEQAHRLGLAALVRAMEEIGQALADMRDSVDPRVTLEVALVRLARPEGPTPASPPCWSASATRARRFSKWGKGCPSGRLPRRRAPRPSPSRHARPLLGRASAAPATPGRPTDLPAKPALGAPGHAPTSPGRPIAPGPQAPPTWLAGPMTPRWPPGGRDQPIRRAGPIGPSAPPGRPLAGAARGAGTSRSAGPGRWPPAGRPGAGTSRSAGPGRWPLGAPPGGRDQPICRAGPMAPRWPPGGRDQPIRRGPGRWPLGGCRGGWTSRSAGPSRSPPAARHARTSRRRLHARR